MAQKPIAMEQLKQILQLQKDGVGVREIARRTGISRNSVRKYLSLLATASPDSQQEPNNKTLADKAYGNDSVAHDAGRLQQLIDHF
ncbi:MAG: helix-turn-helix domain-containing protein, partial [Chitinophagaceae bacterium]|nr:helix-turn-helix domain-containing protein [Chitinophagaceae bacterium]